MGKTAMLDVQCPNEIDGKKCGQHQRVNAGPTAVCINCQEPFSVKKGAKEYLKNNKKSEPEISRIEQAIDRIFSRIGRNIKSLIKSLKEEFSPKASIPKSKEEISRICRIVSFAVALITLVLGIVIVIIVDDPENAAIITIVTAIIGICSAIVGYAGSERTETKKGWFTWLESRTELREWAESRLGFFLSLLLTGISLVGFAISWSLS